MVILQLLLENSQLDDEVTVGDEVLDMYGTNIYIEVGEVLTIRDLLYGLMLRSGNDAAMTLAEQTFGVEKFVEKMNEKAQEIGMVDTIFLNPHGLDDETKNYSSSYDMALLSRYAYQNPTFREIVSTKKYAAKSSLKSYVWYNRMSLLSQYKKCVGGKNGYTPRAGKTLVSYAQDGSNIFTIVSLDDSDIYTNHQELYEKYFRDYKTYEIINPRSFSLPNYLGEEEYIIQDTFSYPLKESEIDSIRTIVELSSKRKDGKVGKVSIFLFNDKIGEVDIYQKKSTKKEEKSFFHKITSWIFGKN